MVLDIVSLGMTSNQPQKCNEEQLGVLSLSEPQSCNIEIPLYHQGSLLNARAKKYTMEKPSTEVALDAPTKQHEEGVENQHVQGDLKNRPDIPVWRIVISLVLLFLNYFLAQYDKFVLSYFQKDVVASLDLSPSAYGILSGYATGIVYALLALPTAYIADYTGARVWVLTVAAIWWSLCAVFQGLSRSFWQILLARIGMGLGQAPVEALSVSLISDLMGKEYVFIGER